jgi:hypothetical protein
VGALFLFGLNDPVHAAAHTHTFPSDADLARQAKESSPDCVIDTDKPLWAENVVTMALGLFDSVQVCHNHYHREQTIHEGGLCCGMADPALWHRRPAGENTGETPVPHGRDELFHRTNETYYAWLNCGFRLAASGGSAMGVMAVPLGYSRTYARLDGPLSEENFLRAVRAGRTFATSGPMLEFTVDGAEPGTVLKLNSAQPGRLRAIARVESIDPLDVLEFICDGRLIASHRLDEAAPDPVLRDELETVFSPSRSGWVIARAIYRNPHDGHLRQAHSSPVYIEIDGKPAASKRDAQVMIQWVDELVRIAETPDRYASEGQRRSARKRMLEARAIYEKIAGYAQDLWGD